MNEDTIVSSRIDSVEIRYIAENIFELIPDDNLEITFARTENMYRYMLNNSSGKISVLVNRRFHFSTPLEVINKHLSFEWVTCWAVLCHRTRSKTLTQIVVLASSVSKERVKIFANRAKLLIWLKSQHQKNYSQ